MLLSCYSSNHTAMAATSPGNNDGKSTSNETSFIDGGQVPVIYESPTSYPSSTSVKRFQSSSELVRMDTAIHPLDGRVVAG